MRPESGQIVGYELRQLGQLCGEEPFPGLSQSRFGFDPATQRAGHDPLHPQMMVLKLGKPGVEHARLQEHSPGFQEPPDGRQVDDQIVRRGERQARFAGGLDPLQGLVEILNGPTEIPTLRNARSTY